MSTRTTSTIGGMVALLLLGAAGVGASRLLPDHRHATQTFAGSERVTPPLARHATGGDRRWRRSGDQVQHTFASAYARFLDGHGHSDSLADASITARGQAQQGGRIPPAFRDGPLRVRWVRDLSATDYSATARVMLADRQTSYPLTIGLLREMGAGWLVTDLDPPDLEVDHPVSRPPAVPPPRTVRRAARAFAVAYVAHHDQTRAPLPAMTATARQEITALRDPLSSRRLRGSRATVIALAFGPLEGDEIAVSATVRDGQTIRFSFLLTRTDGRWSCDAFL